jgi:hypothetical protein
MTIRRGWLGSHCHAAGVMVDAAFARLRRAHTALTRTRLRDVIAFAWMATDWPRAEAIVVNS